MIKSSRSKFISIVGILIALILAIGGLTIIMPKVNKFYAEAKHVSLVKGKLHNGTNIEPADLSKAKSWKEKSEGVAFSDNEERRDYYFDISELESQTPSYPLFVYHDGYSIPTSDVPVVYLEQNEATHVYFELPDENGENSIASLDVRLTINGTPMDTGERMQEETAQTFEQYLFYNKQLSTNYTDSNDNKKLTQTALMGLYTYTFTYTTTTSATAQESTESISFYLIFEEAYTNKLGEISTQRQIEPKLSNTQKNDREYYADNPGNETDLTEFVKLKEQNYFNFQNNLAGTTNTDYFGNANKDGGNKEITSELLYPTYTYDASKYNLSWTHSLNGVTTNYTTEFVKKSVTSDDYIVKIYKNGVLDNEIDPTEYSMLLGQEDNIYVNNNLDPETNEYIPNTNYYITEISFDQVGEYSFTINPVVAYKLEGKNSDLLFKTINVPVNFEQVNLSDQVIKNSKTQSEESWNLFGTTELCIFGYQLYYTDYNGDGGNLEFKGQNAEGKEISADVSYKNTIAFEESYLDDNGKINNQNREFNTYASLFEEEQKEIVTNQAPLSFSQYLATMAFDQNNLSSRSYYLYFPTKNTEPDKVQIKELTNSTKFSSSGYYVLYLTYGYSKYSVWNETNQELDSPSLDKEGATKFQQVFAFQIRNTEPNVKMYSNYNPNTYEITENTKSIYGNYDLSNQNILLTYTSVSQFEKKPSIKLYKYNVVDERLNEIKDDIAYIDAVLGDDYKIIEDAETKQISYEIIAKKGVICWEAKLQYGPNNSTSANYNFVTDTTPIESYFFKTGELEAGGYKIISSLTDEETDNEFIATNSNFYFRYTETKDSGAEISSSYIFVPLIKDELFEKFNSLNTNNFSDIYNGYKLSETYSKYSYGLAETSSGNGYEFLEKTNANYVLTNSGLYIFKFEDSAGNINYKAVLLDKSSPIILIDKDLKDNTTNQDINGDGIVDDKDNNIEEYSLLSGSVIYLNSVNIAYGINKAINIDSLSNNSEILEFINNNQPFQTVLLANLGNKNLSYETKNPNDPNRLITKTIKIYTSEIIYNNESWTRLPEWTPECSEIKPLLTSKNEQYGFTLPLLLSYDEAEYELKALDNIGNFSSLCSVTLSTDNSMVTAYGYENNSQSTFDYNAHLAEFAATSNSNLYISWINESGKYELESLILEYYPLVYDANVGDNGTSISKFYPYAETPTNTKDLLLNCISGEFLNDKKLEAVSFNGVKLTDDGMYVITRKYKNNVSADNGGLDTTIRKYIYFVDRNPIFSTIGDFVIGQTISLSASDVQIENYIKTLNAQNFEQNGSNNNLFATNKLPVTFNCYPDKSYKYALIKTLPNIDLTDSTYLALMENIKIQKNNWQNDVISKTFALTSVVTFLDENGFKETDIYENLENLSFTQTGNYSIVLTDNTTKFNVNQGENNNVTITKEKETNFNLLFSIYEQLPTAFFIEQNANGYYKINEEEYLNYSDNLSIAWNDPTDDYTALIDPNSIEIRITKNDILDAYITKANFTLSSTDVWDYVIDLNNLVVDGKNYKFEKNNEYVIEAYFEYYRNDNLNDYPSYSTTKFLNIDLRIPDENFNELLEADKYLSDADKQNINNYNSLINFENYTFTVDETFKLNYSEDYFNTQSIYYRYYDKYEDLANSSSYINLQSISPNDDRFDLQDEYKRLRFSTDSSYYNTLTIHGSGSNANTFFEIVRQYGYYEIIEIDKAGNVRIFSIYLQNSNETILNINYTTKLDNGEITQDIKNEESCFTQDTIEINSTSVIIDDLFATLDTSNTRFWANADIYCNYQKIVSLKISPTVINGYYTLEQLKNLLNELFLDVDLVNGTSYSVIISYESLLSSTKNPLTSFTLTYNYPGPKLEMQFSTQIINGLNTLYATVEYTPSTKLSKLEIASSTGEILVYDSKNGDLDNFINASNSIYEFEFPISSSINLKFILTDNFNRVTYARYMTGMQDIATLTFTDEYIEKDDTIYTAYQAYADYQAEIYEISIFDNITNSLLSVNQFRYQILSNGLKRIYLFDTNSLAIQSYTISYTDTGSAGSTSTYTYNVIYMPLLGTVNVKNRSGDIIFSTSLTENIKITTVNCYVFIDNTYIDHNALTTDLPFETFVNISYISEEGIVSELGNISNGTCLSNVGKYILTIYNDLGVNKSLEFEIKNAYSRDITIIVDEEKLIAPSSVKYNYAGSKIDWYLTTSSDLTIQISDRYVNYSTITIDSNTKVLELNAKSGENKFIALTIVSKNNDFLNISNNIADSSNNLFIDDSIIFNTTTLTSTNSEGFTLGLKQLYNEFEGNIITIYYTFNNSEKIKITESELGINPNGSAFISFTEAGIYKFYFEDFAGNKQLFRTYEFYKVSLFSEVIALVNNKTKIQNAIYNSEVTIEIQEVSQYSSTTFEISGTVNGVALNEISNSVFSKPNYYTFVFSNYGVYNITISGKMNTKTISTTISFVILNEFEAYTTYEFIAYSNYEITKIVRDGVNVTEIIKDQLSKAIFDDETSKLNSISSIALSGLDNGIGGNGKYSITVLARNLNTGLNNEFTFNVWINGDSNVALLSSINPGESTTNPISIRINPNLIFEKVGMCNIMMNNTLWISIDKDGNAYDHLNGKDLTLTTPSSSTLDYSTYTLSATGNYNFRITTVSGNTLMSFTVTKDEPLNAVAIIVIIISVIAISAVVIIFVRLRKKVKVK